MVKNARKYVFSAAEFNKDGATPALDHTWLQFLIYYL